VTICCLGSFQRLSVRLRDAETASGAWLGLPRPPGRVRAFHIMPGMPGPEGQLHDHDYRIEIVVDREQLDERGMVCDLDVLEAALTELTGRVDGRNLEEIRPAEAEAVTVEVFARWVHDSLSPTVLAAGGETLAVRVWETAVAFGGYRARLAG
jgi:6-pyruvoyltetrahydropterin/6-carboxytetrahydropterin synthase